ncbi:hypothetical protein [Halodesulfurarchaeum formicicum]|uniref:hypothetical protein n=1 Tax=Halodesulfurarchaeum formicicum TaxID=1873524 RepID=UPI00090331CD|nr:hypothetical protein [Halodesulfurarchaeum formicicum]
MSDRSASSTNKTFQQEFRIPVIKGERPQFQLPAPLVAEVGFKSPRTDPTQSAKVCWYYHEDHDKVVLAPDSIELSTLDFLGASALSGVSNDELESGDVSSARVTLIEKVPNHRFDQLKRDTIVLRVNYVEENPKLNGTLISLYPQKEFDQGELPNVSWSDDLNDKNDSRANDREQKAGGFHSHNNTFFE